MPGTPSVPTPDFLRVDGACRSTDTRERRRGWPARYRHGQTLFLAALALLWLILRTGRKPTRMGYPCQQIALGTLAPALAMPLAYALARAATRSGVRTWRLVKVAVLLLTLGFYASSDASRSALAVRRASVPLAAPAEEYKAHLYVVEDGGGPRGDHHLGVDQLIACMGAGGRKFYRSEKGGLESGPAGVVGREDVVLVKINQQWSERGGTNTDVLKGLIARILEHPDGFGGEIVVVENTQGRGRLDWPASNAEDHGQSALDVVRGFADRGRSVSARLWDDVRQTSVAEYSHGDMRDGYVVGPWQPAAQIRVSYPKFRTSAGRFVSLQEGIWDPDSAIYDDTRLTFINLPVLKCHPIYGVTGSLKHHVGTMTTSLSTNTHSAVLHGGLGSFLGQVRMPDLNILDCTYILAIPGAGPGCSYEEATRVDRLVAGSDPVAVDLWATANILVPAIIDNGYTDYPMQDPSNPASIFRTYLDLAVTELLTAGERVTNDPARIAVHLCETTIREPGDGTRFSLGAHPNPFRTTTTIRFVPRVSGAARLEICDVKGRLCKSMRWFVTAGNMHEIPWDGRDQNGRPVRPGTYFYRLEGAGTEVAGKVTLVR